MNALLVGSLGVMLGEFFYFRRLLPYMYSTSTSLPIERAYGLIFLINGVLSSWVVITLSFQVGKARTRAKEEAKKEGDDPDYEERNFKP